MSCQVHRIYTRTFKLAFLSGRGDHRNPISKGGSKGDGRGEVRQRREGNERSGVLGCSRLKILNTSLYLRYLRRTSGAVIDTFRLSNISSSFVCIHRLLTRLRAANELIRLGIGSSLKTVCSLKTRQVAVVYSGSIPACSARGPGTESRCGQLCLSYNHCDLQPWARAVYIFPAVPRSTQPSTLRGTVNEYQLSG